MKLLFVCSRNRWRSPTAEHLFAVEDGIEARSAGTSPKARHTVSERDIRWADLVFVMENRHRAILFRRFGRLPHVIVLGIPDEYQRMDPELIALLRDLVTHQLDEHR